MAYEAGTAFLQVVPSFAGVVESISEEMARDGEVAGRAFRESFESSVRDLHANVNLDTGAADAKLLALRAASDEASGANDGGGIAKLAESAGSALGPINGMLAAVLGLGPALIPLAGLAAGAMSTLPAIFAGAGVGIAAVVIGISGVLPAISAYRATLNTTGDTAAQVAAKHRDLVNAMAGLTPAGQTFVAFVATQLMPIFSGLRNAVQSALLPGVTNGLTAMLPFFQALVPFIEQAAAGIGNTVSQLGHFLGSASGLNAVNTILAAGNGFMSHLGDAAVTLLSAFTTIGAQAAPIVGAIGSGISSAVDAFSRWVSGGGFETFVRWLQANGPAIVRSIEGFVSGLGHFLVALAPVGVLVLRILGPIGTFLGYLARTPAAIAGVSLALGGLGIALAILMDSNPVGLIISSIALLVVGILELITHWRSVWNEIKEVFDVAVSFLRSGLGTLVLALMGPLGVIIMLALHWQQIWAGMQAVAAAVWGWLYPNIFGPMVHFFTVDVPGALNAVAGAFGFAWGIVQIVVGTAWGVVSGILNTMAGVFGFIFSVISAVVTGTISTIGSVISGGLSAISGAWSATWGFISAVVSGVWGGITGAVQGGINLVAGIINGIGSAIGGVASALSAPFTIAFNAIKSIWNSTVGGFGFSLPSWIPGIGGDGFHIPYMHAGGVVPGAPGTDVPTILQAGELVVPRSFADSFNAVPAVTDNRPNVHMPIEVIAYDPRTAAVETFNRAGFALKTRGF